MTKTELLELLTYGENSGVEFKRDDVRPEALAKEMAGLLNLEGGHILLGVEDDGTISGLTRDTKKAEEWVMEAARTHVQPAVIPYWEKFQWDDSKIIGVVSLPADSPDKPYKAKRGSAWVTQIRVGSTTRDATREEEARLYQQSGLMRYDLKPVPGSSFADLDRRRLTNYFRDIRAQDCPSDDDEEGWRCLLINTDLMVEDRGRAIPTAGALILFGMKPNRYLPQAGITAVAYPGTEKEYNAKERAVLRGASVALLSKTGEVIETGVIEQALEFVRRNTHMEAGIVEGGRRSERWDYPLDAIREAVVNAVAHRDYTITVTDVELSIYSDRIEVISPGRLPNTVTVEKMRAGYRASRNELMKEILRDYRYVEATGLGVPRKIVQGMRQHNGTDPDLIEEQDRFTVRLWKEPKRS
ncbi:MAG: putative DNA binding domain-containing protein [Candidatus Tectomicrobia bacterium]|nr:putative DNA binding domain-containing protein [Candidatus Tectomicrobia bacterium]